MTTAVADSQLAGATDVLDRLIGFYPPAGPVEQALRVAQAAVFHCIDTGAQLVLDDLCPECAGEGFLVEPDGMGDTRDVMCLSCRGRRVDVFDVLAAVGRTL